MEALPRGWYVCRWSLESPGWQGVLGHTAFLLSWVGSTLGSLFPRGLLPNPAIHTPQYLCLGRTGSPGSGWLLPAGRAVIRAAFSIPSTTASQHGCWPCLPTRRGMAQSWRDTNEERTAKESSLPKTPWQHKPFCGHRLCGSHGTSHGPPALQACFRCSEFTGVCGNME